MIVSSKADWRYDDRHFARTQSPQMKAAAWEKRIEAMRAWWPDVGAAICLAVFAGIAIYWTNILQHLKG